MLAADTGKINSEMLNVGRAGVLFFYVLTTKK